MTELNTSLPNASPHHDSRTPYPSEFHQSSDEWGSKGDKVDITSLDLLKSTSDSSGRSILKDLQKTRIPAFVASRANSIFLSLRLRTKRRRQRDLVVFFCTYEAYMSLKLENINDEGARIAYTIDPVMLCRELGHSCKPSQTISKFMNDAYKNYGIDKGYRPVVVYNTIEEFVQVYFPFSGLHVSSLPDVRLLTRRVVKKHPALINEYPQKVAAAIIAYYFDTISSKPAADFYDKIMKNKSMLSDLKSQINKTDNI